MITNIKLVIALTLLCIKETSAAGAAKEAPPDDRPVGDRIGAMIIVVIAGAIGGLIVQLI